MNAVAKIVAKPMLLDLMADRAGLKPQEFADTVRATCGMAKASAEEFAAFLMVAKEYNLNPLTKEIYAFPAKGGGIVPVVSIDGWVNLVNSHSACDGFEFDVHHDDKGELVSITCRMFRKDRNRPVSVTEYYEECKRSTDPWKMKHRMLRHKAMIQAARYAFGFSGIYDDDEGAKIAEMRDVTPASSAPRPPVPPAPPALEHQQAAEPDTINVSIDGEIITEDPVADSIDADTPDNEPIDNNSFFDAMETAMAGAMDLETIEEAWSELDPEGRFDGDDTNLGIAHAIRNRRVKQIGGK